MIEINRQMALKYRNAILQSSQTLEDSIAIDTPMLFPRWQPNTAYTRGQRICGEDTILYTVLQDHTSQLDWPPSQTPALYARVLIPDPSITPEWIQPDSTNPYMKGDKVLHNNSTWISDIDNNVWEPGVYGWSIEGGN